ncbi:phosphotransferase [Actinoplanes sp. NPDC023714]|uniref:phosphotransferase n=1 Tax=Actinoplanes sp. NPDC023714 TaxID=3154322 RepID=UPI0033F62AFD
MDGGKDRGAVRVGGTVRRTPGRWTPAVHALLRHLEQSGFDRAPRPLGLDADGRETLTYLPGETVGSARPWPAWVYSDDALVQVARWLRDYHAAVAGFRPPAGAVWREGGVWRPGLIIAHNDAAPYNAAWRAGRLTGFFDWDLAAPLTAEQDLAGVAFSWVPLHARAVVAAEGFTAFAARPRRLRAFLHAYGWSATAADFSTTVQHRVREWADTLRATAAAGDPTYRGMLAAGVDRRLDRAADELAELRF